MPQRAVTAIWVVLVAGAIFVPILAQSTTLGDDQLRLAIRVALVFYFAACLGMLRITRENWRAAGSDVRIVRLLWSLGWMAYVIHVLLAFHHAHQWSHANAMAHTQEASGFDAGIFVTHLFTLLWLTDVAFWWLRPERYVNRPAWIGFALHGFMAFIIFNGTVIYESGPIRWAGAAMFLLLAVVLATRSIVTGSSKSVAPNRLPS